MKTTFSIFLATVFLLTASTASAQVGMMGSDGKTKTLSTETTSTVTAALENIYTSQGVSAQNKIDCNEVSENQFEYLGDAVMGQGITEEQHAAMEDMMGGEGSENLKKVHSNIGVSYLGCWANRTSRSIGVPMMGYGQTTNGGWGMMGNQFSFGPGMIGIHSVFGWFGLVTIILVWVLLILSIVTLAEWLRRGK